MAIFLHFSSLLFLCALLKWNVSQRILLNSKYQYFWLCPKHLTVLKAFYILHKYGLLLFSVWTFIPLIISISSSLFSWYTPCSKVSKLKNTHTVHNNSGICYHLHHLQLIFKAAYQLVQIKPLFSVGPCKLCSVRKLWCECEIPVIENDSNVKDKV